MVGGCSHGYAWICVTFVYENTNVVFLEETCEFVFLKKSGATITMRASDASQVSVVLQIIPIY
jgi:hypothetical protein